MICDSESNANTSLCRESKNGWFDAGYEKLSKSLRRSCCSPFKLKIMTRIAELMLTEIQARLDDIYLWPSLRIVHKDYSLRWLCRWRKLLHWLLQEHLHRKPAVHVRKTACGPVWWLFQINYIYIYTPIFVQIISISIRGCIVLQKHLPEKC